MYLCWENLIIIITTSIHLLSISVAVGMNWTLFTPSYYY